MRSRARECTHGRAILHTASRERRVWESRRREEQRPRDALSLRDGHRHNNGYHEERGETGRPDLVM